MISGKTRVIDGDSIAINEKKIRLFGIDAPELGLTCSIGSNLYYCGKISKEAMKKYVEGKIINCSYTELDKYRRILAICRLDCFFWGDDPDCAKFSLNRYMVHSGNALAYKRYSKRYLSSEQWAKNNKLGIWQGDFENPEEWRKKDK
ncbi:MAG: nuclease [Candidatus Pelagibacter sp.]|nr:nuclease [Candidatus Pelagibacter sp.]